ncbi:MAG: hypothetical protein ABIP79_01250 [Chitinophagaceae bacterium]
MPDFEKYAIPVLQPGTTHAEATLIMGVFVRDVMKLNWENRNFRVFGPDETASNRLLHILEITGRTSTAEILENDNHISPDGRVMEALIEHLCQGWLEGYLLTAGMVCFHVMKRLFIL